MASFSKIPTKSLQSLHPVNAGVSGFQQLWRLWFSRHNWLTWLGLAFALPLALFFWQHYSEHLRQQQHAVFQQHADTIEHELQQRLQQMELLLVAKAAFVSASEYVSQIEWQHYIQRFDLPKTYPGIQASGVVSYRHKSQLPDLMSRLHQELQAASEPLLQSSDGLDTIILHPSTQHPDVAIVSHIQPLTPLNQAVLGYDMLSDPVRAQTAMRAASLNQAAVTAKILLRQDEGRSRQPGLIMMLPFYQSKLPLITAEQKQQALLGFVYVAFRVKDILPTAWHDQTIPLPDIFWASAQDPIATELDPAQILYARTSDANPPPSLALKIQKKLDWYGQPFVLQIKNNINFESSLLPLAEDELVLLGGVAFILLVLLLSYLNLRRYQAQTVVKQLQRQIQQQRQALLQDEQRQSLALKASQLVWFEFDFRTGGAFYSDSWWRMFDFPMPQPNPEPQHLFDLLHAEDEASFRQDLQRFLASGPDQAQQSYRFISRQGRQLFCQVNFYVVRAPEGDAIRLCCSMQDLTKHQQQAQKQQ